MTLMFRGCRVFQRMVKDLFGGDCLVTLTLVRILRKRQPSLRTQTCGVQTEVGRSTPHSSLVLGLRNQVWGLHRSTVGDLVLVYAYSGRRFEVPSLQVQSVQK